MAKYWEVSSPRPGKDGKTHWTRVGTMFESKNGDGFNMVFDALPLPDKEGRVAVIVRPPRPRDGATQSQDVAVVGLGAQLNDEVPW